MYRALALPLALAAALAATTADAQMQRRFPATALRGELVIVAPPEVRLNGQSARLSPGTRIRDTNNMLAMSASLVDVRLPVHYTIDINGEIGDVWLLRPEELAVRPWPRTPREAQEWQFDPMAQTWTKP